MDTTNPFIIGDEVATGMTPEDYAEGIVHAVDGDRVLVHWRRTETTSWVPAYKIRYSDE